MKDNKIYIVLIAIVLVFFLVIFLLLGNTSSIKEEGYDTIIVVGDDTVWGYKDNKWSNFDLFTDLNGEKFDVYTNNVKNGNYYLTYTDKWNVYDDDGDNLKIEGDILAIKSSENIPVSHFNTSELDDYSYVKKVLEDNELPINSQYTVDKKIVIDYDDDGLDEDFYLISNAFPLDFDPDNIFSMVFMVKNGEIYPIYNSVEKNKGFNGCKPYISGFIDVNNDSKYEVILSCAEYSISGVNRMLYEYKNSEFKILISNNK